MERISFFVKARRILGDNGCALAVFDAVFAVSARSVKPNPAGEPTPFVDDLESRQRDADRVYLRSSAPPYWETAATYWQDLVSAKIRPLSSTSTR